MSSHLQKIHRLITESSYKREKNPNRQVNFYLYI